MSPRIVIPGASSRLSLFRPSKQIEPRDLFYHVVMDRKTMRRTWLKYGGRRGTNVSVHNPFFHRLFFCIVYVSVERYVVIFLRKIRRTKLHSCRQKMTFSCFLITMPYYTIDSFGAITIRILTRMSHQNATLDIPLFATLDTYDF